MNKIEPKIYSFLMLFFVMTANASGQERSIDQPLAPEVKPRSSKVVEIETDIDEEEIKPSALTQKNTIKPRQDYFGKKTAPSDPQKTSSVKNSSKGGAKTERSPSADKPSAETVVTETDMMPAASDRHPKIEAAAPSEPSDVITDDQVVTISESLRKLIEDNNKLKDQISQLDVQLKTVKGQQKLEANRYNEIAIERDALRKQNEKIVSLGSQSDQKLQALQKELNEKEEKFNQQIVYLQTQLAQKLQTQPEQPPAAPDTAFQSSGKTTHAKDQPPSQNAKRPGTVSVDIVSAPTAAEAKERGDKVLVALSKINEEKQKLLQDEARVHYNMGNTFYSEGDYLSAAKEYRRTLEITPEDSSAHYNLAFVSSEYLNQPKAALEHYKKYLFYNPKAEDTEMVRQKIIEAESLVRGDIRFDSQIGTDVRNKKNEVNEMMSK